MKFNLKKAFEFAGIWSFIVLSSTRSLLFVARKIIAGWIWRCLAMVLENFHFRSDHRMRTSAIGE